MHISGLWVHLHPQRDIKLHPCVRGQPALAWDGDKVDFACASGGEGPVLQSLSALGVNASPSTNRAMHDLVTKLALLSKM